MSNDSNRSTQQEWRRVKNLQFKNCTVSDLIRLITTVFVIKFASYRKVKPASRTTSPRTNNGDLLTF